MRLGVTFHLYVRYARRMEEIVAIYLGIIVFMKERCTLNVDNFPPRVSSGAIKGAFSVLTLRRSSVNSDRS